MIFSLCFGTFLPATQLALIMAISGFSYRTSGKMCIINHEYSFTIFWAWWLTLSVAACLLQGFTSVYCLLVFLRSQRKLNSLELSSNANMKNRTKRIGRASMLVVLGFRTRANAYLETDALNSSTWRQRWNQIKAVLTSQWRVFVLVAAMLIQCTPFVAHFVKSRTHTKTQNLTECFLMYGMHDERCLDKRAVLVAAQPTILAGLIIAAVSLLNVSPLVLC